ncbi:MAG: protein kinase domain-containing protein [Acidimicrobiales bacterium]
MPGEVDLGIDELSEFEVIGTGGFSTVYGAWDEGFRRRVAVKVLYSLDEAGQRRFNREREIMGQLSSHPNVIMPFRAGYTPNGAPYLVMELVEGGSLQDLVDQHGRVPWPEAVDYVLGATTALGHAHERNILHRDVKPANILLADNVPKLTDFGIAAIRESTASQVAYTLAHCPPEAFASGRDARDDRSDLYSMASTLYCLLAGQAPFDVTEDDSQHAYMFRIIEHQLPELPPGVAPEELQAFLRRALAKDPAERPQSATEFLSELAQMRTVGGATPGTTGPQGPGWSAAVTNVATTGQSTGPSNAIPPTEVLGVSTDDGAGTTSSDSVGVNPAATGAVGPEAAWPPPQPKSSVSGEQTEVAIPGASMAPASVSADASPGAPPVGGAPESVLTSEGPNLVGAPSSRRRRFVPILAGLLVIGGLAVAGWWFALRSTDTVVGPEVAWTFETGSSLSSRPSVADGTLIIGAHITDKVHAIDTATGLETWSFEAAGSVDGNPAILDDVVYIGSADGMMHALDFADGEPIWSEDVGSAISGGALVTDELVVVGNGDGEVVALDRTDGAPRWTAATTGKINSTPVTASRDGNDVIVVGSTDGGLYLLEPETGEQIERIGLPGGVWFSIPLVTDRPNGNGQELWVGTSGENEGFLHRVDLDRSEVATFDSFAGVGTNPVMTEDGLVIAGNDGGQLFAVDRVTLGEVWREGYADETQIKGSPAIVGDQVVFGTHGKELIAVTTADGVEVWRFEGEQIFGLSSPVVVGDQIYVGNDSGTVYRFDL